MEGDIGRDITADLWVIFRLIGPQLFNRHGGYMIDSPSLAAFLFLDVRKAHWCPARWPSTFDGLQETAAKVRHTLVTLRSW